jgi:patatin-like phospholipase/acyl hydrolase
MQPGKTPYQPQLETARVLSLDGGGLKGIFSAAVLADLEKDLGIRIQDYFDLIVGTSTGGLIAIGLGLGLSPAQMLDFYVKNGPAIFPQGSIKRKLLGVRQIARTKLDSEPLYAALRAVYGEETKLGNSTKRLVVTSFDLNRNVPVLLKTSHAPNLKRDCHLHAWKVAAATGAAPTYLPAIDFGMGRLVDGGVWANNPSMVGALEATELLGVPRERISVLSIGTSVECKVWPTTMDQGGYRQWLPHLSNFFIDAQSAAVNNQCLLYLKAPNWVRVNCTVPADFYQLDKLSTESLCAFAAGLSRDFSGRVHEQFIQPGVVPSFKPYTAIE